MGIATGLLAIVASINLLFAGAIYIHGNKTRVLTSYILISVFASLWSLATLFTGINFRYEYSAYFELALHFHYIFGYLAYLSFLWFAIFYPPLNRKLLSAVTILTFLTTILLFFIPFSNYFYTEISGVGSIADRALFNPIGYWFFVSVLSIVFIVGLIVFTYRYTRAKEKNNAQDSKRILYITLANFFAGTFGIVLNLIFPGFGNFDFFYINPILVTCALTSFGLYALIKYHIFNIRVIVAEVFIFAIWLIEFAQLLVSSGREEFIYNAVFLLSAILFGLFLIRSVAKEVEQREKIEKLAQDLEKANERLRELDRQKTEFVSIASHQLRSPLTAIEGYASMLLEGSYGKFPKKAQEALERIFRSSRLMASSVEDFLNVSRIEQGRMQYNKADTDIANLARTVVEELEPVAQEKGLSLTFSTDNNPSHIASVDFGKMKQVFSNLIDNAIKYTENGSVTVSVTKKDGNSVLFSVKDSGVGISKDTIKKLFDKFVRARNAHEVNVSGSGLGLYVAKQMVEAHGGTIWAESSGEGKGSTFFVELKSTQ